MVLTAEPVVVGVDGSGASRAAVSWGVESARLRAVPLHLVAVAPTRGPVTDVLGRLQAAAEQAHHLPPRVTVTDKVLTGDPGEELLFAARNASALVVGSRGTGGFPELLLGSVAHRVSEEAGVPVVVVRGRFADEEPGPVVVGLDVTGAGSPALGYAFDLASRRGLPLDVVNASAPAESWATAIRGTDELDRDEARVIAQQLAGWRETYPDVAVTWRIVAGRPAGVLVEASRSASLVVVGDHVHDRITRALIGSTTRALLNHASCPVVVAHGSAADRGRARRTA
jgi:nucleotide-binding universal stress UspA family protein